MFVNTAQLHSGGNESYRAGEHAQAGVNHLSGVAPVSGMFGDFADADDFHEAVAAAHSFHVSALQQHRESLNDVGARAHHTANAFSEMDERNAEVLRELE